MAQPKLKLIFGTGQSQVTVADYLDSYDVEVEKVYDENLNYKSVSGAEIKNVLGVRRKLTAKFEPMSTAQIHELFNAIGLSQQGVYISYIDPMESDSTYPVGGSEVPTYVTKQFTCEQLPTASYFESDEGYLFWTIPDIEFTETASSWGGL